MFNFNNPKPTLIAGTDYILVVWGKAGSGSAFVGCTFNSSDNTAHTGR